MAEFALIVPADLPGPSGGLTYNQRVLAQWHAQGLEVDLVAVPGAWPHPCAQDRQVLVGALRGHRRVLIDGIIASAAPQEIQGAASHGTEVAMLVHLPLPAESGLSGPARRQLAAMERAAVHAVTSTGGALVCTSRWAREDLRSRYGLDGVAVAEPGVDAAPLAAGSAPPRLFFLGAVTPRKNPLQLLETLQGLIELPWSAVFAGPEGQDPGYAAEVRTAAERIPGRRAAVVGPMGGPSLEALWSEADLLVLPSLAETYGMVVTEALARGIPALVGAGTGAEEALRGAPGGIRAGLQTPGAALDPVDPAAWSGLLRRWSTDHRLREQWRDAAHTHRVRLRTWADAAQDLRTAISW